MLVSVWVHLSHSAGSEFLVMVTYKIQRNEISEKTQCSIRNRKKAKVVEQQYISAPTDLASVINSMKIISFDL